MEIDPIVSYAIQQGIKIGIETYKNEQKAKERDKRILITKSDAENRVGGRTILRHLEKRGCIQPYRFSEEEVIDEDGDLIKRSNGSIYYKLSDLMEALEKGNLLRGIGKGLIRKQ